MTQAQLIERGLGKALFSCRGTATSDREKANSLTAALLDGDRQRLVPILNQAFQFTQTNLSHFSKSERAPGTCFTQVGSLPCKIDEGISALAY